VESTAKSVPPRYSGACCEPPAPRLNRTWPLCASMPLTIDLVLGTPLDVLSSELAIESFFPADAATAEALQARAA
jgi:hypothetical protein